GGGFLSVEVEGENFTLSVQNVCGVSYGGQWRESIVAICTSNPGLNETTGQGTTLINVLQNEWHDKLLRHLIEGKSQPQSRSGPEDKYVM
ncbi:MAG: hypothetical protein Q7R94_03010, partial [bacterium]|nr:hypothetical protein [bacterium]